MTRSQLTPTDLRALLVARFPVLARLSEAQFQRLLDASALREAPHGSVLFEPRQPCAGFPLLLEGSVRVSKTGPNGREIVLYRVESGEGCVLSGGCLLGHTDHSATGTAEGHVRLLLIPPPLFRQLIVESEPFRDFVFDMYAARLTEVMQLVEEVAFRKLDTRLATLLVHRGPVIEETHQRLADELGSVREVVSRMLRNFEQNGWIRIERERLTVLDPQALAALARTTP